MKKYILFGNIVGIGGWQIYIDGKVSYLKENGWEVYVFCPKRTLNHELIKLNGLKEYEKNMMSELCYSPYHLTSLQQKYVIDTMISIISPQESSNDKVIVESTSMNDSLWGELLSKRLGAKHVVYLLHSHFNKLSPSYISYFNFKYERKELAGMAEKTLLSLFRGYRKIDSNSNYYFKAAGKNPISNSCELDVSTRNIISEAKKCDYLIGAFGTLNKPHSLDIFEEVKNFAYKHIDKKIAYIVIGSSLLGTVEENMLQSAKKCTNLTLLMVKEMYPVPEQFFKAMDVCIGSWGSARVAAIAGAKTIRLSSDIDIIPQGVIGYTLTEEPYSQYDSYGGTLLEILEDVLLSEKYNNMQYIPPLSYPDYHEENDKFMHFIKNSSPIIEYYSISKIKPLDIKQYFKKYLIAMLGFKIANKLFNFFRKEKV